MDPSAPASSGPSALPAWLSDLLLDLPRGGEWPWPATALVRSSHAELAAFGDVTGAAGASEAAGLDVVHKLVNDLLAAGAEPRQAHLEVRCAAGAPPPVAAVAGALRGLLAHGILLTATHAGPAAAADLRVQLRGAFVAAVRHVAIGDRIVVLGGEPERGAARKCHASVLHHPLRNGQVAAIVPVHGSLAPALRQALPPGTDVAWADPPPAVPGMVVFAPAAQAAALVEHVRLWNEPVALVGEVMAGRAAAPGAGA